MKLELVEDALIDCVRKDAVDRVNARANASHLRRRGEEDENGGVEERRREG